MATTFTPRQYADARFEQATRVATAKEESARHRSRNVIPANHEELFREYYNYVNLLVRKAGIPESDSEDVAMNILITFMEKGALTDYDPEFTVTRNGVAKTAAFRTFLSGFVLLYVRYYRERIQKRTLREGVSTDTVLFTMNDSDQEVTFLDIHAPAYEEGYDALMTADLIGDIRSHVAQIKPRNGNDRMDLSALFDVILVQIEEYDEVRPTELAEHFSINRSTTFNWLRALRKEIASVVEARAA